MMHAADLRYLIVIQEPTTDRNSYGEDVPTWSELDTVYAAVEPLSGRELFEAQHEITEVMVKFTIRYRDDVTAVMRISFDSDIYNIKEVINVDERDRMLTLLAIKNE